MSEVDLTALRINGDRLWQRLMSMARIGATQKGGCNRQALTTEDKLGRDLFIQWCETAGCQVRVDEMGNIFARRQGEDADMPPVVTGSHLDTQPTGGKFDGVYGVLAGLEVVETLNDHNIQTRAPIEIVVWTNEEGARFSPAMIGSGVWTGVFDLAYGHSREDKAGIALGEALADIGYLGTLPAKATPITAAYELHIEQGPILENADKQVGVVSGVQGMRWYDVTLQGDSCHAGPTPMVGRRDPMRVLGELLPSLYALADQYAPWGRVTFGDIKALPGARNTVPETVVLAVDLRHPDQEVLDAMDRAMRASVDDISQKHRIEASVREEWHSPAVQFNPECVARVQQAVTQLGFSHEQLFSGAGHDAVYLSRVAPTSMIFVPCEKGLSHNELENAKPEDLAAGCNVLLHAMLLSS